jgi:hypothetical protein
VAVDHGGREVDELAVVAARLRAQHFERACLVDAVRPLYECGVRTRPARSAGLADDHARRDEQAGRQKAAAKERAVADRAREAARRARARVDRADSSCAPTAPT